MKPTGLRVSLAPLSAALLLAACSSAPKDPEIDYKKGGLGSGRSNNSLVVPPDLITPSRDDRYSIPGQRGAAALSDYNVQQNSARGSQASPAVAAAPADSRVRMERAGSQRWLVVPGNAQSVYAQLREFWLDLGFNLEYDKPEIGVMETDWQENRAKLPRDFLRRNFGFILNPISDTGLRDRFRTRVEAGPAGTVEIYVSHRGAEEKHVDSTREDYRWELKPANPELEAEMLRRIMLRLGAPETMAKEVVAQAAKPTQRAQIVSDRTTNVLTIDAPLDRAWRQLGLALDRVGLVVEDRDRARNTYFVRYVASDDAKKLDGGDSFLSRLAFWRDRKKAPETRQYRIVAEAAGERTSVRVLGADGVSLTSDVARQLLVLLHSELQ